MFEHEALYLSVFRHERDPEFDGLGRGVLPQRRAVETNLAGFGGAQPEDRLQNFGASTAHEAREPMYLSLAKREIDVMEPVVGNLGQGENRVAARRPGIGGRGFVIRCTDVCLLDLR